MVFILILIASLIKPSNSKQYGNLIDLGSSSINPNLIIPFTSPKGTVNNDSPGSRNQSSSSGLLGGISAQRGEYPIFVEQNDTNSLENLLMYSNET